jgi:hypothetical protein
MRVSGVFKKQEEEEAEVIPASRVVLWGVIGLVIAAGLVLYFLFDRFMTPLL